jgi:tetratricopeptide (TPR) repeat protein
MYKFVFAVLMSLIGGGIALFVKREECNNPSFFVCDLFANYRDREIAARVNARQNLAKSTNNDYEQKILDASVKIQKSPTDLSTLRDRGFAYIEIDKYDLAIADFSIILAQDPQNGEAYFERGLAYHLVEKYELAISDFTAAINNGEATTGTFYFRGLSHSAREMHEEAIADYSVAIAADPKIKDPYIDRRSYMKRADEFLNLFDLDSAVKDFNQAVALYPSYADTFEARGRFYNIAGNATAALADFNIAISLDPNNPSLYNSRGIYWFGLGKLSSATEDFSLAIKFDPKHPSAYANRALSKLKMKKLGEALADADKSLELNPNDADHIETRGQILDAMGDTQKAILHFKRALSLKPGLQVSEQALVRLGIPL